MRSKMIAKRSLNQFLNLQDYSVICRQMPLLVGLYLEAKHLMEDHSLVEGSSLTPIHYLLQVDQAFSNRVVFLAMELKAQEVLFLEVLHRLELALCSVRQHHCLEARINYSKYPSVQIPQRKGIKRARMMIKTMIISGREMEALLLTLLATLSLEPQVNP